MSSNPQAGDLVRSIEEKKENLTATKHKITKIIEEFKSSGGVGSLSVQKLWDFQQCYSTQTEAPRTQRVGRWWRFYGRIKCDDDDGMGRRRMVLKNFQESFSFFHTG